jgi:DHA1 family bicyclomycin/chloramphenicol resistance-like MFS transporter
LAQSITENQAFKIAHPPLSLVLLLGALTASPPMSTDMYLPSLPAIARDFHAVGGAVQGTIAAFLAGLGIGQFIYGSASDRWGRRWPMLVGASIYVVASLACALAPSLPFLITARFFQAIGGCAGQVIGRAVVRDRFDHRNAARVLSMLMLVSGMAPILAPLLGGILVTFASWRLCFWVMTIFGAIVLVWAFFGLEESRSAETAAQARNQHPLRTYGELLRSRKLVGFALAQGLNQAALFIYISAGSGLLIGHYGVSPPMFGVIFGLNAGGLIAMSQINAWLLKRHTPERILIMARPATVAFAALMVLSAFTGLGGLWGLLIPLFFIIGSFGFIGANTIASGLNIDPRRAGAISSLLGGIGLSIGAVFSGAISLVRDTGPKPMSLAILVAISLSAACLYVVALRDDAPGQGKPA